MMRRAISPRLATRTREMSAISRRLAATTRHLAGDAKRREGFAQPRRRARCPVVERERRLRPRIAVVHGHLGGGEYEIPRRHGVIHYVRAGHPHERPGPPRRA